MIDDRIADILERYDRRQRALATGSSHVTLGRRGVDGPLPDAVSPLSAPTLIWPDQRGLLPKRCWRCNAASAGFEHELPSGLDRTGASVCVFCTHTVVVWKVLPPRLPQEDRPGRVKRGRPSGWCIECNVSRAVPHGGRRCSECYLRHHDRQLEHQPAPIQGPPVPRPPCTSCGVNLCAQYRTTCHTCRNRQRKAKARKQGVMS